MGDRIIRARDVRRMSIKEFRERGYLQEVNRRFLHPLGMAIEVEVDPETGDERLGGVWDYRAEPHGMAFDEFDRDKAKAVEAEIAARSPARRQALGYWVQE
jgi:hypothetical protein